MPDADAVRKVGDARLVYIGRGSIAVPSPNRNRPDHSKYSMSSTVQQIINRALGKLGIIEAGGTPTTNDQALALQALKAVYRRLITTGVFGDLIDVIPQMTAYTAGENERIVHDGSVTVTLPTELPLFVFGNDYGMVTYSSDNGQVRPPRDGSIVTVSNTSTGVTTDSIYDGQIKQWISIEGLTATSVAPMSQRDENGLACLLALDLADEFGQQITATMTNAAALYKRHIAYNWSQAGDLIQPKDHF